MFGFYNCNVMASAYFMVAETSCIKLENMSTLCLVPTHSLFIKIHMNIVWHEGEEPVLRYCIWKLPINVVSPHPLLMLPLHTTNSARLPGVAGILQGHGMKWTISRNKFREGQSVSLYYAGHDLQVDVIQKKGLGLYSCFMSHSNRLAYS